MRTQTDALRSISKYAAVALGAEWDLAFARAEGDFQRPFCRVNWSTAATNVNRGMHHVEIRRTAALVCFPAVQEGDMAEELNLMEAQRTEEKLLHAFGGPGAHVPSYRSSSNRGHPRRVPLYDYSGVTLNQAATARATNDFLRVIEDPQVNSVPDPANDRAYIVTLDLRVAWSRSIAVLATEPLTEEVNPTPVPEP